MGTALGSVDTVSLAPHDAQRVAYQRVNAARLNIKSRCIDSGKDFIGVYGSEQHKARRSKTNKVRRGTDACHFSETKPK
ncbi:hypothetical protein CY34DRAFT_806498 [Suillus luteus UH-Slu-Lm8-n1]|uniref:Uncharacterized protein n=1 Tax=Suillus luteus UH-Slu-Lm8-n1 TaxID=930992 RepID=A0A0D0AGZ8_9AGAM|nr:hypothetical protein CY34DRAFT_806498 [Suillus luteus UH-Slu-Lm8-n1]